MDLSLSLAEMTTIVPPYTMTHTQFGMKLSDILQMVKHGMLRARNLSSRFIRNIVGFIPMNEIL